MRLVEWVTIFDYFNTNTATQIPTEVNNTVRILQPNDKSTPRKTQWMNPKTPPEYDKDNPQVAREWILSWFSHYIS